ncbi:type VII toxin-antitoxin system HepT family RNase toxin [Paenibacillus kyungheensis]
MNQDILLNKTATIRRCVARIHEEYAGEEDNLFNYTKQDSIILNLQRACEACLDLAIHIISERNLGVPQSSRDVFDLLFRNGILDKELNQSIKAMVGFRNIAIHDYQGVQVEIIQGIIEEQLDDFEKFIAAISA